MNQVKPLRFLALAAITLTASAATVSANPLTSPSGAYYTESLKAESSTFALDGSFTTVSCKKSSLEGKVEADTEYTASGKLASLAFSECNFPVTVVKPGSLEIEAIGEGQGTVRSSGAEIKINTSVGECVFTTSKTDIGTLTGSNSANAVLDLSGALLRTGGSFLCGPLEGNALTGSYKFTTPGTLSVDYTALPNPLTSPSGAYYTESLKAESSTFALDGSFTTVSCKKSSLEGKVEADTEYTASGKLASLAFSECNFPVTVVKPGSLEIEAIGEGQGTVRSSGAEIKINTSVGECVFTTSKTDIGTLTGSNSTNAVLDLSGALLRTGGSFLCGPLEGNALTGSYKVTTPGTLSVDYTALPNPLTSPSGAYYTESLKAESSTFALDGSFTTVSCKKSSLEGKVEADTEYTASGKLASLAFSECNFPVTVVKPGSLEIEAIGEGQGTVRSSGAEIKINTSVGECVFTTSKTDIGTLTGSNSTNAVLDLSGALLRTGGSFLCGPLEGNALTGSYKVTTPGTLSVDY